MYKRYVQVKDISELERGDIIRHKTTKDRSYIVDGTYGDNVIAVDSRLVSNANEWEVLRPDEPDCRLIVCSAGKVEVTIGDVFAWRGLRPGKYEVMGFTDQDSTYSASGSGVTCIVCVRNSKGKIEKWAGDSVACGVFYGKIIR